MLASVYFGGFSKTSMVNFRQQLAQALIENTYVPLNDGRDPRRSPRNESEPTHKLCALPCGKKILNGQVVDSNMDYSQRKCSGCKRKSGPNASALLVLPDVMNAMVDTFLRQNRLETMTPEFR